MKKIFILITAAFIITATGCTGISARKAMKETASAIANCDYSAALNYAEFAIKEGCDDKEFLNLVEILKTYIDAKDALDINDVENAEKLVNEISDFEGSGMTTALNGIKENIKYAKKISSEFDDDISKLEQDIEKGYYYTSSSKAKELLDEDLTVSQKEKVQSLYDKAEQGKKSKSNSQPQPTPTQLSPKAMLSEQEAIDVARSALSVSANAKATATLIEDYYQINFEDEFYSGGELITDETSCKVKCKTGEVYDQAG